MNLPSDGDYFDVKYSDKVEGKAGSLDEFEDELLSAAGNSRGD